MEPLARQNPKDRLQALPENVRLGRKGLLARNALAYCGAEIITPVKFFMKQVLAGH